MSASQFSFNFASKSARPTSTPRMPTDGYPFDLDGSLDYVRPATGWTLWPEVAGYPNGDGIGCVSGFMPQMDAFVYAQMIARIPWGPTVDHVPADPTRYSGQVIFPMLPQIGSPEFGSVNR